MLMRAFQKDPLPNSEEWTRLKELCAMAIKSGLLPQSIRTPEAAFIIVLKGRELGIPPMQAFAQITVINGKPAMNSELMLSLIRTHIPNAKIEYIESSNEVCKIRAGRPNGAPFEFSFSMEDAERAGLTRNPSWAKYPQAMLRARCISAMARAVFPDALMGVSYTPEELGAEVDEEGSINLPPSIPKGESDTSLCTQDQALLTSAPNLSIPPDPKPQSEDDPPQARLEDQPSPGGARLSAPPESPSEEIDLNDFSDTTRTKLLSYVLEFGKEKGKPMGALGSGLGDYYLFSKGHNLMQPQHLAFYRAYELFANWAERKRIYETDQARQESTSHK